MADAPVKPLLEQFAELLHARGVEFIVIGGQAENLWGSPRVTVDVDLCYERSPANIARLAAALRGLNAMLRTRDGPIAAPLDARMIEGGGNFTLTTRLGDLDLLAYVEPIGGFDDLAKTAVSVELSSLRVRVASIATLLRIKEHLRRPKDAEAIAILRAIVARDNPA